jgi:hypothetical protein
MDKHISTNLLEILVKYKSNQNLNWLYSSHPKCIFVLFLFYFGLLNIS